MCHCPYFMDGGMPREVEVSAGGWLHVYSGSRKEETHVLLPRLVSSYGSMYPVPGSTHLPSTSNLPTSQKVKVGGINKKPSSPLGLNTHLTLREITAIFSYLGRIPPPPLSFRRKECNSFGDYIPWKLVS